MFHTSKRFSGGKVLQKSVSKYNIFQLTASAILIALGILIPMVAPRVVIGPASFTLASHVVIFIAMFISPKVAVVVTLGTTLGFFIGGFPLVIVFRAASHLIWAWPGAVYLSRIDTFNISPVKLRIFSLIIGLVHGVGEVIAVSIFFFGTGFPEHMTILWILGFIGLGTVIHSMVDLEIANVVRLVLQKQRHYRSLVSTKAASTAPSPALDS